MKFHIGEVLYPREREGSFARNDGCFVTSRKSSLSSGWKEDFEGAGYTRNRGCRRGFKLAVKFHRSLIYNIKADKIFAAVEYNSRIVDWEQE